MRAVAKVWVHRVKLWGAYMVRKIYFITVFPFFFVGESAPTTHNLASPLHVRLFYELVILAEYEERNKWVRGLTLCTKLTPRAYM
jgi:hypothetical protein